MQTKKILVIERELYLNLLEGLSNDISTLQEISRSVAFLDCVLSFSTPAISSNLNKPIISEEKKMRNKKRRDV